MTSLSISAYPGIGEIHPGDDLAAIIIDAIEASPEAINAGDIFVVTSKIVSKAEGRQVSADDREAAIDAETIRVVASKEHPGGITRIVENRQGLILAAAGVDNSNTPKSTVLLLPENPDASALQLCTALRQHFGVAVGIIISDTLGRAWREGQTDTAIGAAGLHIFEDYRGTLDSHGNVLSASTAAVADEIAGAANLVKSKATGQPVALVRGLGHLVLVDDEVSNPKHRARALIRPSENDMFRLGSKEAYAKGFADGQASLTTSESTPDSVRAGHHQRSESTR